MAKTSPRMLGMAAAGGAVLLGLVATQAAAADSHFGGRVHYFVVNDQSVTADTVPPATVGISRRQGHVIDENGKFVAWADQVLTYEVQAGMLDWTARIIWMFPDESRLFLRSNGKTNFATGATEAATVVTGGTGAYADATGTGQGLCTIPPGQPQGLNGGYFCATDLAVTTPD